MNRIRLLLFFLLVVVFSQCSQTNNDDKQTESLKLYQFDENAETRWASFENPNAEKGKGGMVNKGAKGSSNKPILAGESKVLLDVTGPGIINRIWLTVSHWQSNMLPSLKIEIFWDGSTTPAVSAPLGDFFCKGLGRKSIPFQNVFFSDPEGRAFNCVIPMPYKSGARVVVTNESKQDLSYIFYDINFQETKKPLDNLMYFHAFWHRDTATTIGEDFKILPQLEGKGRFLGTNLTVRGNPAYGDLWWGEGEVKMYLDGDSEYPTLAGTGTEDYIGTAWGQGIYVHDFQGCLVANKETLEWSFYRFHVPDPVWFHTGIKVTIQQIGAGPQKKVLPLIEKGVPLKPVAIDMKGMDRINLLDFEEMPDLGSEEFANGGILYYRSDDVAATAYFYLDKPVSGLLEL